MNGHHHTEGADVGREPLTHTTGLPAKAEKSASVMRGLRVENVGIEAPQVRCRAGEEQQDHDQGGHVEERRHVVGLGNLATVPREPMADPGRWG